MDWYSTLRIVGVFLLPLSMALASSVDPARVQVQDSKLIVDGVSAPFLFGAEVQYFRARGGSGRNVPAETVHALWEKLLDRVVEAKMNTVIFYIPWDFHEPVEGVYDFDGKLDLDRDGRPDYPSRNLKLFFQRVRARGIKHIMVRPGPYINAEWGPEGFGAVPKWFLDKYPQALAKTLSPNKPRTATLEHPEFRKRVVRWFKALHSSVLKNEIGPGKSVDFLQIDNESNFFWDSVYERDWNPVALTAYKNFIYDNYGGNVDALRKAYGSEKADFKTLMPPKGPQETNFLGQWHYDWFHYHDVSLKDYYQFLKATWSDLGVTDKDVLFTSCDSFNAPANGLLPRLDYRQDQNLTLSTMNVYPKTYGTVAESTMNTPMKAAHDAFIFRAAQRQFRGDSAEWLMSSETAGGWFAPTETNQAMRAHTYGSLLGSGVKAMIIYYFHEGYNWTGTEGQDSELFFDAPLDRNMEPRATFQLLKSLGSALEKGLGADLVSAKINTAPILIAHDITTQYPMKAGVEVVERASTHSAGLFGMIREAGATPEIGFINRMSDWEIDRYKVIFLDSPGHIALSTKINIQGFLSRGGVLVTLGGAQLWANEPGKIFNLPEDIARDWNNDSYGKNPATRAKLQQMRVLLSNLGMELPFALKNQYVHAWTQRLVGKELLYIENFGSRATNVLIETRSLLKRSSFLILEPLWGTNAQSFIVDKSKLSEVSIPQDGDSISIWSVRGQ